MRKLITILLLSVLAVSVLLTASGCGNTIQVEIDFDEIIEANSTDALLERFGSIRIDLHDADRELYYYADDRFVYTRSEDYLDYDGYEVSAYGEIVTDAFCGGYENEKFYSVVYAGLDVENEWTKSMMINPELFSNETLISSKENNGMITFQTKLTESQMIELGYWDEDSFDGCYYLTEYKIDKETKIIYEMKEIFVYGTGIFNRSTVEYKLTTRVTCPVEAENIYQHITESEEICKATVVFDPNTEEEKSFTVSVPKGDVLFFYWADYDVYVNAYSDRACTKPFAYTAIANEDIEIYVTK